MFLRSLAAAAALAAVSVGVTVPASAEPVEASGSASATATTKFCTSPDFWKSVFVSAAVMSPITAVFAHDAITNNQVKC